MNGVKEELSEDEWCAGFVAEFVRRAGEPWREGAAAVAGIFWNQLIAGERPADVTARILAELDRPMIVALAADCLASKIPPVDGPAFSR